MSDDSLHIGIIGTGLIGGSIALDLKRRGFADFVYGYDADQEHLDAALENGLIDAQTDIPGLLDNCKVVILAIPVDAIVKVLPGLLDQVTDQVIIEVGSTKTVVMDQVKDHPNRKRLISAHPMAGTEYSGPSAALYNLFDQKCVVFCDVAHTDADALHLAGKLFKVMGMYSIEMEIGSHDLHAAYVSHISHITSFALANTVLQKEQDEEHIFEMASGGFSSTVRLAKSAPSMWGPIFMQNKEHVIDVLDEHIRQLQYFKECLQHDRTEKVMQWMTSANDIRRIIK